MAKLKAGGNVNIAFFGDSITYGAEAGTWWSDRSKTYTDLTIAGLRKHFPSATISETLAAEGGKSAVDTADIFQKSVLDVNASGKKIDLVVIAMGMNDLGKPNMNAFNDAMRGYIQKWHDAGMEVMLVTPIQSNIYYEPKQIDRVPRAEIAQAIRDVANETDTTCIDMWTEWQNLATHGIAPLSQLHNMFNHPGEVGHQLYASTILRVQDDVSGRVLALRQNHEDTQDTKKATKRETIGLILRGFLRVIVSSWFFRTIFRELP